MLRNIEKRVPAGFRQENKKSFRVYLTQAEGQVFGIGVKIFTISGPVILYGIVVSWFLGIIYYILQLTGLISGGIS